jgi:hypothetical protein
MAEPKPSEVAKPDETRDKTATAAANTETQADLRAGTAGDETPPDPNSHTR